MQDNGQGRSNPRVLPQRPNAGMNLAAASCAQMGRDAVTRCFQSNGGYQMQHVVAVLSNGTQGPIPRNVQQVKTGLCSLQGTIIACIFSAISNLRNTQTCPAVPEYIRLEQEAIELVSRLQQMCGNGPLPAPDMCHRSLFNNLKSCYTSAGLDGSLFSPNATAVSRTLGPSQIIGSIIGKDTKSADKFCRVKQQLYTCLNQKIERCPGASEILALSGYDVEAIRNGIDVVCHDVGIYLDGVKCFNNKTQEAAQCYNTMIQKVADLSAEQARINMPPGQYNSRYCQLRVQHMECDLSAWDSQCEKSVVGLKHEFECNLLPSSCKNDGMVQRRLQQTCAIARFQRQLRSGSSRSFKIASVAMTILSLVFGVFLL
ncbi:uncharacterized protein LOC128246250 [Mya arenaria]|uniref:uncharacterized protein LOC128246250 n=1 Tax=Mya arenaria TaxID=6604 RepID=UPI0022E3A2F1|nr:uncharacterized protein LOC128246250 [Mya arenaria]